MDLNGRIVICLMQGMNRSNLLVSPFIKILNLKKKQWSFTTVLSTRDWRISVGTIEDIILRNQLFNLPFGFMNKSIGLLVESHLGQFI